MEENAKRSRKKKKEEQPVPEKDDRPVASPGPQGPSGPDEALAQAAVNELFALLLGPAGRTD